MAIKEGKFKVYVSGTLIGIANNIKINTNKTNVLEDYEQPQRKIKGRNKGGNRRFPITKNFKRQG